MNTWNDLAIGSLVCFLLYTFDKLRSLFNQSDLIENMGVWKWLKENWISASIFLATNIFWLYLAGRVRNQGLALGVMLIFYFYGALLWALHKASVINKKYVDYTDQTLAGIRYAFRLVKIAFILIVLSSILKTIG